MAFTIEHDAALVALRERVEQPEVLGETAADRDARMLDLARQVATAMPRDPMRPEALDERTKLVAVMQHLSPTDLIHLRRPGRVVRRGFRG